MYHSSAIIFYSQRPWPRQDYDKDAEKKAATLKTNKTSFSMKVSLTLSTAFISSINPFSMYFSILRVW